MKYLIDTNIISELISNNMDKNIISFFEKVDESKLFLSVITIGKIKFGIEKLSLSKKKDRLISWFYDDLMNRFNNKIVSIDTDIMLIWGKFNNKLQKSGQTMPIMDSLIAATCISDNFILVTRNEKDFKNLDIEIINPFLSN